jgi:hypothetical protein
VKERNKNVCMAVKRYSEGQTKNIAMENVLKGLPDVWRWQNPEKSQMFPFLLQNPQWSQRMNRHEPCK